MRYSAMGLVLLTACGSGSSDAVDSVDPVTADDLNRFQSAISRAASSASSTPFADIPTGSVTYQGGMSMQWESAAGSSFSREGIRGIATLTTQFGTGGVTGEVTDIMGSEGLAFDSQPYDGTLEISGVVLPNEADYVVGTGNRDPLNLTDGLTSGRLTGPDGAGHVFAAEFSADLRGEDAEYFYGVFDGGTVTVDGDARNVTTGVISVTTEPVTLP